MNRGGWDDAVSRPETSSSSHASGRGSASVRTRERSDGGAARSSVRRHGGIAHRWWYYLPGVVAGLVGCGVFLVLHALWVVPIWFVAPLGGVVATIGGVLVNAAFVAVKPRLPPGVLGRCLALGAGGVLVLTPTAVLVQVGDPYLPVVDGAVRTAAIDGPALALRFVVEFLLVTALTGAGLGWLLTRRRRGALVVAGGAVALALGPGHNLPFFQAAVHPVPTRTAYLLTVVPLVVASVVLVVVDESVASTDED